MTKRYRALVNAGPLTKRVFVAHGRVTRYEPEPHKISMRTIIRNNPSLELFVENDS